LLIDNGTFPILFNLIKNKFYEFNDEKKEKFSYEFLPKLLTLENDNFKAEDRKDLLE
jgi:hypothetical protein